MRIRYVNIYDLIFNGDVGCEILKKRPDNGDPYLVLIEDEFAMRGRGLNELKFKTEVLAKEFRVLASGVELHGPSLGLFDIAYHEVMKNRQKFVGSIC